jgi:cytochrome c553
VNVQQKEEEENQKAVCFVCHREGHNIQTCFKLFSYLKNKEDEERQDHKSRYKNDGYKNKKKVNVMQAMWSAMSDDSDIDDSSAESEMRRS